MASVLLLGYSIRLFEQQINNVFQDITTAWWNILITISTDGYGDFFAKSDCGRVIAIITGFWGIFFLSLFVISLLNLTKLDDQEWAAYSLM
ncbi:MAG: ion channel [Candidatus Roizmanbacteria bacterium]